MKPAARDPCAALVSSLKAEPEAKLDTLVHVRLSQANFILTTSIFRSFNRATFVLFIVFTGEL